MSLHNIRFSTCKSSIKFQRRKIDLIYHSIYHFGKRDYSLCFFFFTLDRADIYDGNEEIFRENGILINSGNYRDEKGPLIASWILLKCYRLSAKNQMSKKEIAAEYGCCTVDLWKFLLVLLQSDLFQVSKLFCRLVSLHDINIQRVQCIQIKIVYKIYKLIILSDQQIQIIRQFPNSVYYFRTFSGQSRFIRFGGENLRRNGDVSIRLFRYGYIS